MAVPAAQDRPGAEVRQPIGRETQGRKRSYRLVRRVVTTLIAWLAAYLIVTVVFVAGGPWLASAPTPVRLLVASGVLVIGMVNVLMPALSRLVDKLFGPRR
jgi:antibiotic biosynthesis monooxygenase (ABM) superfamily enzyme